MYVYICEGVLIEGGAGMGKSSLARWIAKEGAGVFRCCSVSCADLVHKVC